MKFLTSIDNSWFGLRGECLSSLPVNSSSGISFKRELPEDRLTALISSKSGSLIRRPFNYCFSPWYSFLLQFVRFPRKAVNHAHLAVKRKSTGNVRNHSEGSENRVFASFILWKHAARQHNSQMLFSLACRGSTSCERWKGKIRSSQVLSVFMRWDCWQWLSQAKRQRLERNVVGCGGSLTLGLVWETEGAASLKSWSWKPVH